MSDEYDNTNRFALFKNKNKREGKKDADYNGSINIAGVDYWINAWVNTSQAGQQYLSGSIGDEKQPAQRGGPSQQRGPAPAQQRGPQQQRGPAPQQQRGPAPQPRYEQNNDMDDTIPF